MRPPRRPGLKVGAACALLGLLLSAQNVVASSLGAQALGAHLGAQVGIPALPPQTAPVQPLPPHVLPPSVLPPAAAVTPLGDSIYPQLGQAGLDVLHYDLHLTVEQPGTLNLRGQVTLTLAATATLSAVQLDARELQVTQAEWNGVSVAFTQGMAANKLTVPLAQPLLPGQTAHLKLVYTLTPAARTEVGMGNLEWLGWQAIPPGAGRAAANFAFSEPDGMQGFVPSNDHPSDPATFTTTVTVPLGVVVGASGVQDGPARREGDRVTYLFQQRQPIPTYALGIHVGPYQVVTSPAVPVGPGGQDVLRRDYFLPTTPQSLIDAYRRTDHMLTVLSDWFGPYPFSAYGVVVINPPVRYPALETATLSTMPETSSREVVALHEVAHQWFGNSVLLGDWADTWLNEGFATYAELLWAEATGENSAEIVAGWYSSVLRLGTRPLVATEEHQLFDVNAYRRGALALHALRRAVGDARFKAFLRTYVARYSGRSVRTADLLNLTRQELGEAAHETLRLWVESASLPPQP